MNYPVLIAGLAAILLLALWTWHCVTLRRCLVLDRAAWRRSLARNLTQAATDLAVDSEAASAALAVLAEVVQGSGEIGALEASVLHERVLAGTVLDDKRAREALLLRMATMLHGITGARELLRVMRPETRRDTSLRDDALSTLDAVLAAHRGDAVPLPGHPPAAL